MLNKTITFGLGKIMGYDVRSKTLYPVDDEKRKRIYEEIRQGFRDFARLCNFTTNLLYTGKILKVNLAELGYNTGYKPILEKLNLDTHLNGMVLNQAFNLAKAHFTGDHGKGLMGRGDMVLPTHKADGTHPIYFHQKAVKLYSDADSKTMYILYNLFADAWAKKEEMPSWIAFQIRIKKRDQSGYSQLERILSGEWKHGSGQLVRSKREIGRKYLMHLVAQYEPDPYKTLLPEIVMGIDLGYSFPASIHIRLNGEPQKWAMLIGNGKLMQSARNIVRREIVRLLRGLKKKDSPLHGPAREAALNKLRELRKQEIRLMKTASQKLASLIADQAKRNGAGIWQMEDLSLIDMKEGKPWLTRNWAPGMLIDAIKWQAKQIDAQLKIVNPRYTSQRCNKCGYIDRENRPKKKKGQSYFKCVKCEYEDHADKNAARNLSIIGIDKIIQESIQ